MPVGKEYTEQSIHVNKTIRIHNYHYSLLNNPEERSSHSLVVFVNSPYRFDRLI